MAKAYVVTVNGKKVAEATSKAGAARMAKSMRAKGKAAFIFSKGAFAQGFGTKSGGLKAPKSSGKGAKGTGGKAGGGAGGGGR